MHLFFSFALLLRLHRHRYAPSLLLFLVGVLFLSSCERAVIPESKFADIYHDIFLADTYVNMTPSLVGSTDSIVVYQGIIEKHGWTVEQFNQAHSFYLAHPDKYAKLIKILQQRMLKEHQELRDLEQASIVNNVEPIDSLELIRPVRHRSEDAVKIEADTITL